MVRTKKPFVLIDANLLAWMPGLRDHCETDKFVLDDEKQAFKELMGMKKQGRIVFAVSSLHFDPFRCSQRDNPEVIKRVGEYFHENISLRRNFVISKSELDLNADSAVTFLRGQEKQDDPVVFVWVHFIDPSITHVASHDAALSGKFDGYEEKLGQHKELSEYWRLRKRGSQVFTGLPTQVLDDIKRKWS
ncbi:MAG: hypothetical protein V3T31_11080, partial [candidate division Zixibacteria bacterium]